MRPIEDVFAQLARSKFRTRLRLNDKDRRYFAAKRIETVRQHARDFIVKRLAPAQPINDGRQTPWRGHPVFVAQHATATCCRSCLEKWHAIPKGRELTEEEREHVVDSITHWLKKEANSETRKPEKELELF
jgi:hypothetical protein